MHFVVRGKIGNQVETVTWRDGLLECDNAIREWLEFSAQELEEFKIAPISLSTDFQPSYMSDPLKLLFLLIHKTLLPPILKDGEIIDFDLPTKLPSGSLG